MPNSRNRAARDLAQWLIARDEKEAGSVKVNRPVAFDVCDKLTNPLKTVAGVIGISSLLSRALALAKTEAPSLEAVIIDGKGCLDIRDVTELQTRSESISQGGEILLTTLLGLLITFIGESLTLRFVHEVWPDLPIETPNLKTKRQR